MPPARVAPASFHDALRARLAADPGQPLVTFYDDLTGERTELSVTTYANWVAKTAGVLTEDLDLQPPDTVRLDLPSHWLGPVFLGAIWLAGLDLADADCDLAVVGPAGTDPAESGAARAVLACSLHPFALPFTADLPPGAADFGTLWPGQPDSFAGAPGTSRAQSMLLREQAARATADRVLTDLDPAGDDGAALFLRTLIGGGSVIWVAHPAPEHWAGRATSERADRTLVSRPG